MELFLKYGAVFFGSMLKFVVGPVAGAAAGLSLSETTLFTIAGMMASVVLITYLGQGIKALWVRFAKPSAPKTFTKAKRRTVYIWKTFGLEGIAFFTPLILTPIGGTLVALAVGARPRRILGTMLISAMFWGLALSWAARHARSFVGHSHLGTVVHKVQVL